jgi:hypothetical protein
VPIRGAIPTRRQNKKRNRSNQGERSPLDRFPSSAVLWKYIGRVGNV